MSNRQQVDARQERRLHKRVVPKPLLVIHFQSGNYGVVVDASREGVGFVASAPVVASERLRFEVKHKSIGAVALEGEVQWRDEAGTRGGIRVASVPKQFLSMLHDSADAEIQVRDESQIEDETEALKRGVLAAAAAAAGERQDCPENRGQSRIWKFLANSAAAGVALLFAVLVWQLTENGEAFASLYRLKVPSFLSELTRRAEKTPETAPRLGSEPPAGASTLVPSWNSADAIPLNLERVSDVSLSIPPEPIELAAVEIHPPRRSTAAPTSMGRQRSPFSDVAAKREKALAGDLAATNATAKRSVETLWQAVGKKDVAAEVELAGLYLKGETTSKSCGQAIILLTAARSRKNVRAEQIWGDLPKYGCEPPSSK